MSARTMLGIAGWVAIAVIGLVYFLTRDEEVSPTSSVATVLASTPAPATATTETPRSTATRSGTAAIPDPQRDPLRYAQWFCGENRDRILREAQTRDVDRAATWYANGVAAGIRLQTFDGCRIGLLETEP